MKFLRLCSLFRPNCLFLLFITFVFCFTFHYIFTVMADISNAVKAAKPRFLDKQSKGTKYILLWDHIYLFWKQGRSVFPTLNCPTRNCVFLKKQIPYNAYLSYVDAIIFPQHALSRGNRPSVRSSRQIYIFTTSESSCTEPVCDEFNDNFFNWTLTYRLDSHIPWPYFTVRNSSGAMVAPSIDVVWDDSYQHTTFPIQPDLKSVLSKKTKAAIWLVSHCPTNSVREDYLYVLQEILLHFSLRMDVYGRCSYRKCPFDNCGKLIRENYFFYMAFENSIVEDYVTEKVLNGYENMAVPIVYGGANYSRFLPPGSFIDANKLNQYNLALLMLQAVTNQTNYEQYFKWRSHYTISSPAREFHPLCSLCAALQTEYAKNAPVIKKFRKWWMGNDGMKWCLSDAYWKESSRVNIDAKHLYRHLYRHERKTTNDSLANIKKRIHGAEKYDNLTYNNNVPNNHTNYLISN